MLTGQKNTEAAGKTGCFRRDHLAVRMTMKTRTLAGWVKTALRFHAPCFRTSPGGLQSLARVGIPFSFVLDYTNHTDSHKAERFTVVV